MTTKSKDDYNIIRMFSCNITLFKNLNKLKDLKIHKTVKECEQKGLGSAHTLKSTWSYHGYVRICENHLGSF